FQLQGSIQQPEPDAMRDSNLSDGRLEAPVSVEELALRGTARQRLKLVLAVDIDKDVARLSQQLHGDRLTVHVSARAPIVRDHTANGELVGCANGLLFQPALQLSRCLGEIEGARDLGALGAVPDNFRSGAATRKKLQGITRIDLPAPVSPV